jgi:hypothetical protein
MMATIRTAPELANLAMVDAQPVLEQVQTIVFNAASIQMPPAQLPVSTLAPANGDMFTGQQLTIVRFA